MNDNYEILKDFYEECNNYSLHEIIERWSSINIVVPAFTGAIRDSKIKSDFNSLSHNLSKERKYIILAKRYRVSKRKVIKVIKSTTAEISTTHPTLFDT